MEAPTEKSTLAEQRAQKKAARRAAFIQDIAEAVGDLICGTPSSEGPFATAYHKDKKAQQWAERIAYEHKDILNWARGIGLLPVTATELPSAEIQAYLLATRPSLPT